MDSVFSITTCISHYLFLDSVLFLPGCSVLRALFREGLLHSKFSKILCIRKYPPSLSHLGDSQVEYNSGFKITFLPDSEDVTSVSPSVWYCLELKASLIIVFSYLKAFRVFFFFFSFDILIFEYNTPGCRFSSAFWTF